MIIQSHRGAGKLAPENTLESFELAWSINTVPEADVRCTKDGVAIAFHDNTPDRLVANAPVELRFLPLEELAWDVIKDFDVGSYKGQEFKCQRIPRMSDIFEAMRGKPERLLYLDVKNISLEKLASLASEKSVLDQQILASTNYDQICEWKSIVNDGMTLHWMGGTEDQLRARIISLQDVDFKCITQLQIHVRVQDLSSDDPFNPSSDFLRMVAAQLKPREILFQTLPMNSNKTEVYHRLFDLGVESFATDDPYITLEAVKSYTNEV